MTNQHPKMERLRDKETNVPSRGIIWNLRFWQKIDNFVSRVALESAWNSETAQPHLKKNVKTPCQDSAPSKVKRTKSWHACQDMLSDLQNLIFHWQSIKEETLSVQYYKLRNHMVANFDTFNDFSVPATASNNSK